MEGGPVPNGSWHDDLVRSFEEAVSPRARQLPGCLDHLRVATGEGVPVWRVACRLRPAN